MSYIISLGHWAPFPGSRWASSGKGCRTAFPPWPCPHNSRQEQKPRGSQCFLWFLPFPQSPPLTNFSQTHCLLLPSFTSCQCLRKRREKLPSYTGAWGQRASVYPLGHHWRGQSHFWGLQSRCRSLWGRTQSLWRKMGKASHKSCVILTFSNRLGQDKLINVKEIMTGLSNSSQPGRSPHSVLSAHLRTWRTLLTQLLLTATPRGREDCTLQVSKWRHKGKAPRPKSLSEREAQLGFKSRIQSPGGNYHPAILDHFPSLTLAFIPSKSWDSTSLYFKSILTFPLCNCPRRGHHYFLSLTPSSTF